MYEVICLDNPLMRPMPNDGLGLWGEIQHLVQRLGDVLTRQDIDKKSRDTWLDLISEPTGCRGHNDGPFRAPTTRLRAGYWRRSRVWTGPSLFSSEPIGIGNGVNHA